MNNANLEIGFWHTFGAHGQQDRETIIRNKKDQIGKNGWTLWAFQFTYRLKDWLKEIEKIKPAKVLVFCSSGKGKDPADGISDLLNMDKYTHKFYRPINESEFIPIPSEVITTLPSKRGAIIGSAFKVKNVIVPKLNTEIYDVEWLLSDGDTWRSDKIPTRGEYLIRFGQGAQMRPYSVILELEYPYIAEIRL